MEKTMTSEELQVKMNEVSSEIRNLLIADLAVGTHTVEFNKVNGDYRKMSCTLDPNIIPAASKSESITQKKVREISEEVLSVWDTTAQGWRSFRIANLISFK
jgi:hypothetical protein